MSWLSSDVLLSLDDLAARYGKKRSTIGNWSRSKRLGFPKSKCVIDACRKSFWALSDLLDFEARHPSIAVKAA